MSGPAGTEPWQLGDRYANIRVGDAIPAPSPAAAEIAKIKERAANATMAEPLKVVLSAADVPPLVAAIEAVLALAHTGPIYVRDEPVYDWTLDPAAVCEAIESALHGPQGGEGQ